MGSHLSEKRFAVLSYCGCSTGLGWRHTGGKTTCPLETLCPKPQMMVYHNFLHSLHQHGPVRETAALQEPRTGIASLV